MSNLGWYQTMTTAAKKVGGPLQLLLNNCRKWLLGY